MNIIYSEHAKRRMKQRAITELEVEHVLQHPDFIINSFEGTQEAIGKLQYRTIKIKFISKENYIKIITVM